MVARHGDRRRDTQSRQTQQVWQRIGLAAVVLIVAVAASVAITSSTVWLNCRLAALLAGRVTATTGFMPQHAGYCGCDCCGEALDSQRRGGCVRTLDAAGG